MDNRLKIMNGITAVVLGIDAAWTSHNPSGVALAVRRNDGWAALAASASYDEFISAVSIANPLTPRPTGSVAELPKLLDAAMLKCSRAVDVIAVDMPLAMSQSPSRNAFNDLRTLSAAAVRGLSGLAAHDSVVFARNCGDHDAMDQGRPSAI